MCIISNNIEILCPSFFLFCQYFGNQNQSFLHFVSDEENYGENGSTSSSSECSSVAHTNFSDPGPNSRIPGTEHLTREERRRRRRATPKYRLAHASRERVRVEAFNSAFGELRSLLPTLPPDKRLSKIEILRLAICYIAYLNHVLER